MNINKSRLLSPKTDVVFHALFGEANKDIAEFLISDILDEKVKIKSYKDRVVSIAAADQKISILDFKVQLEDGTLCNIEMQRIKHISELERMVYYATSMYSTQIERGDTYSKLNRTISIVILDHVLEELNDYEEIDVKWLITANKLPAKIRNSLNDKKMTFKEFEEIYKKNIHRLTNTLQLHIIEVPKAKRFYDKNSNEKINQWMLFIDDPNSKEVAEIMNKNEGVKQAKKRLEIVSGNDEIRRIAELEEKAIKDELAAKEYIEKVVLEKGFKKGIEQGIEQGVIRTAKNMLNLGIDIDIIAKATGINKEEISKLK